MTDEQHGQGTPPGGGGRWDPLPQGDYDDGATAFVTLPEGGLDAQPASSESPLAAPGHGYVPPQITVAPATTAGTDPAATGSWAMPPEGAQWPDPNAGQDGSGQDRFAYNPGATQQWSFEDAGTGEPSAPAPGHDVTGQWSIPVANGDIPDESGEFTTSSLVEQWGGTPPTTLPGGASAPWATHQPERQDRQEHAEQPGYVERPGRGEHRGHAEQPGHDGYPDESGQPSHAGRAGHAGQPAHGEHPRHAGRPAAEVSAQAYTRPAPRPDAPGDASPPAEPSQPAPVHRETADATPETGSAGPAEAPGSPAEPPAGDPPSTPAAGQAAQEPATAAAQDAPDGAPEARPEDARGTSEAADAPDAPAAPAAPHDEHPLASYVLRVNGAERPVADAWIGESLLYVLRERLGLAGAKDGCSQGECGACNVQVDGRLVASCLVPAATAAGSEVRTVEGLAADGQPSDVQRALAKCGAVQCGFCVPGMAMTVHDLLEGNPAPTELETRQALCGNLCRCSGYRAVLDAVKEVVSEREAHAAPEASEHDGDEPRIPQQAGPGAGGVNASAFESPRTSGLYDRPDTPPDDRTYGNGHGHGPGHDQGQGQDGGPA